MDAQANYPTEWTDTQWQRLQALLPKPKKLRKTTAPFGDAGACGLQPRAGCIPPGAGRSADGGGTRVHVSGHAGAPHSGHRNSVSLIALSSLR